MATEWTDLQPLITFSLGVAGFLITAGWVSASWLNRKFGDTNTLIDLKIEKLEHAIVGQLQYHERHDDDRFKTAETRLNEVKNDIWDIRVRNAGIDNATASKKQWDLKAE